MEGWIKLHRKIINWEWYTDINVKVLFLHLLLTANHTEGRWQGKTIGAGEVITSISHLSQQTGLSIKQVRTALEKLESTGEIEREGANKNSRIKLLNYCVYQTLDVEEGQTKGKQAASKRQTKGKQRATNNNDNNKKNDKNDNNYFYKQNNKNFNFKNKNKPMLCTPSFDITEIERRAVYNDDYDI
ncbi:MAG: hypothetical protein IJR70_05795 [Eubacterium sp.]|nr:hypothetical protein [Eubacterium sp.]